MRRNFSRTFFAAAFISIFFTVSAYAESAVITGRGVNFRAGPGTNYYVIATLDSGTRVEVLDRSNSSWYAVSYNGCSGFISSSYLRFDSTPADTYAPPAAASGNVGTINSMYVRFRSGPSSQYSVLGTYNAGKQVTILGAADGWTACLIDGQLGYVYSQYISPGGTAAADTSPEDSGITLILPNESNPALPQPDESGSSPVPPAAAPVTTPSPAVTPAPVTTPPVVSTPAPTDAPVLPSPSVTAAPVTTPVPAVTPVPSQNNGTDANLPAYIVGSYVRFRSGPGTNYSILGSYNTGKALTVHRKAGGGWLYATVDGRSGYIYETYVLVTAQASYNNGGVSAPQSTPVVPVATPTPSPDTSTVVSGYIAGNNVRFRSAPSMSSSILAELFYGNAVTIHAVQNGWALVSFDGKTGYVYAQYVKEGSYGTGSAVDTPVPSTAPAPGSFSGQDVANYAMQFLGCRYTWGGKSPDTGFDCSGLVYYVYQHFGYTLNRVAQDQARNGVHVDPASLQPGDIICFYSGSSYIGHVGIYIGNDQFIHSSNSTTGVIISQLSGAYTDRGYEARRILN